MSGLSRRKFAKTMLGNVALGAVATASEASMLPLSTSAEKATWQPVAPGIWKVRIGTPDVHSPVRSRLLPSRTQQNAGAPAIPDLSIEGQINPRGAFIRLPLASGELMYGFGLQLQSFQQRSKKRTIRVNADPKGDSGDSHAPVPFYVTTRGYGVFVDTFRNVTFACGNSQPVSADSAETSGPRVDSPASMRTHDREVATDVRIEIPRASGVDVYLFAGPTMLEAVKRYNMFSGGGVNPPAWGLGFWYRPELHLNTTQVLDLMKEFRASEIPCDVIGLEPGWQSHAYSCSFTWDDHLYPDPGKFIQDSAAQGFHINLWEHAYTHPTSPIYKKLRPHSGDYEVFHGLVPDFAAEPACQIFADHHAKAFIDAGISGFKLDECDNSDFTSGWSWPDFASYPSGLDGEQMHSAFGIRYQHTVLSAFRSRNKETFGLVRSSGSLATPYPFVLYSDLYDHREFIRGLVNSGFSGMLWCPEVRDATSEEDLIRRLQSVVFSPLAMVNAWYIKNPPWKQIDRTKNNDGVLAQDWKRAEARCREIIGWRMSLVPYLQSAFAEYAKTGMPPFRSPLLDFPQDASLTNVDDEYMIGDRMLVAPLFAGETQRVVTLPEGKWHDFWSGETRSGKVTVEASFKHIPVYVRENSVIPWAGTGSHTADPKARTICMRTYGNASRLWQTLAQSDSKWISAKGDQFTIIGWDRIENNK